MTASSTGPGMSANERYACDAVERFAARMDDAQRGR